MIKEVIKTVMFSILEKYVLWLLGNNNKKIKELIKWIKLFSQKNKKIVYLIYQ